MTRLERGHDGRVHSVHYIDCTDDEHPKARSVHGEVFAEAWNYLSDNDSVAQYNGSHLYTSDAADEEYMG